MSGGSMDYLYSKLEYDANFHTNTLERKAFKQHLARVARALHDIEWVDSGDFSPGSENEAIRKCLAPGAVLESAIQNAKDALAALQSEIAKAEKK